MSASVLKNIHRPMRKTGILLFLNTFMGALKKNDDDIFDVIHLAYASEILLKARIAQEHPLLIFSDIPKIPKNNALKERLSIINLFLEKGRTFSYNDLPDQLWATTGISINKEQREKYTKFGHLRNQLIHISLTTKENLNLEAINYSLEVLSPLIHEFWGKSIIDFIKHHPHYSDEYYEGRIEESIIKKGITIDNNLRELLGEESKQGYEKFLNESGYYEKEAKKWEEQYGDHPDLYDDPYGEAKEKWSNFFDSFCNS